MSTTTYSKNEANIKIDEKVGQALYTPNTKIAQLEANQLTGSKILIDNVFVQGLSWDSATDTYTRLGSLAGLPMSVTAGNSNLPIHSCIKKCTKKDDGSVNYYMNPDEPFMKEGIDLIHSGISENLITDTFQVKDTTVDFTEKVSVGDFVFVSANIGTTNDYIAKITSVAANLLIIDNDIVGVGTSYKIGNFDYLGTDGQVMMEYKKFYVYKDLVGTTHTWLMSLYKLPGYVVHPMFIVDGVEVDYRYFSCFEGSMYDASASAMTAKGSVATSMYATGDKMCSVAQQWAKTNESLQEYRPMAQARGTGWENVDLNIISGLQWLYLVEYADFNAQATIGQGRTALSGGSWSADSYIGRTGLSILDGNGTNSVSNGGSAGYLTDYMTYRGIENFFGNVWKMVDKVAWDGRWTGAAAAQPVYITNKEANFADQSSKNLKKLVDASYIGTTAGYIADIENNLFFIPKSVGASSTTKLTDYYYQYSDIGRDYWRVFLLGGNAIDGGTAGAFALAANAWSSAVVDVAGRLCF